MSVQDYSTNPDDNLTISGINIAEGMPPGLVNNAIRQLMSDIKTDHDSVQDELTTLDEEKAPAGFGLGGLSSRLMSDCHADNPAGWWYTSAEQTVNAPSNTTSYIIFVYTYGDKKRRKMIAFDVLSHSIYEKTLDNGVWKAWIKLFDDDGNAAKAIIANESSYAAKASALLQNGTKEGVQAKLFWSAQDAVKYLLGANPEGTGLYPILPNKVVVGEATVSSICKGVVAFTGNHPQYLPSAGTWKGFTCPAQSGDLFFCGVKSGGDVVTNPTGALQYGLYVRTA